MGASSLPYLARTTERVPWPAAIDGGLDSHFDQQRRDWEVTMFPARTPGSRQQVSKLGDAESSLGDAKSLKGDAGAQPSNEPRGKPISGWGNK